MSQEKNERAIRARIGRRVAEAAALKARIDEDTAHFDAIKEEIREAAKTLAEGGGQVEFESPVGICKVAFVRDQAVIQEGTNPYALLHHSWTQGDWNLLFAEKVVLADSFEAAFAHLTEPRKGEIRALVEWRPREPRVTLPKAT